jgi:pyruvate,water dikinase
LNNTILVTASTDPGWVVLFPSASAIVVERGSLLSHSAIVSREMGIPCIVGVKDILSVLQTGDIIEIDGTNGTVTIIEKYG